MPIEPDVPTPNSPRPAEDLDIFRTVEVAPFWPPEARPDSSSEPPHRPKAIPNIGSTLLLIVIAGGSLFLTEIGAFAIAMATHLFGSESTTLLMRDPRLLIPSMAIAYLVAGALTWAIFTNLWRRSFSDTIRWNAGIVHRRFYVFLGLGILLSVCVQLLSNYLPIPKALPIDDFFRTPTDVWFVAIFGTFIAPVFEELAFRGFLIPSLATAWDWAVKRHVISGVESHSGNEDGISTEDETVYKSGSLFEATSGDPRWSTGALIFSSILTSVAFAMLHADQLAHSWTPLVVLFTVSIVLCLVRLQAHSLAASTVVHSAYNGTIFLLLFYATDGFRHLDKMNL